MTIFLAWLLDALWGEPPARLHPVVWMGSYLRAAKKYNDGTIKRGVLLWAGGATLSVGSAAVAQMALTRLPVLVQIPIAAVLLKPLFAWRALKEAAQTVADAPDLPEARKQLSWSLVSRDTSELSAGEVYGATIESVAENLSDSVVAPLFYYCIGGLTLAGLYRYANTADAMWGYRTPELERFGKMAARTDDVLNWIPARLTTLCLLGASALAGKDTRRAFQVWRRDSHNTSSPNAGQPMSTMAGILGRQLTKRGVYSLGAEFDEPTRADVERTLRVTNIAAWLVVAGATLWMLRRRL